MSQVNPHIFTIHLCFRGLAFHCDSWEYCANKPEIEKSKMAASKLQMHVSLLPDKISTHLGSRNTPGDWNTKWRLPPSWLSKTDAIELFCYQGPRNCVRFLRFWITTHLLDSKTPAWLPEPQNLSDIGETRNDMHSVSRWCAVQPLSWISNLSCQFDNGDEPTAIQFGLAVETRDFHQQHNKTHPRHR